jgi:predicted dehydrogenase
MTSEISFGVAGLGFGANHARVLSQMDGVRLAAVCDSDPSRLEGVTKTAATKSYPNARAMLAGERLDAVVVAVPAGLHEEVALAAMEAGCAVLVEKPLAPSLAAGRRLVQSAAAAGVPLMAGHIERFNPAVQEAARRVQAGEIGRVLQITARRAGALRTPPADVNVIHDSALHDIDAARLIAGAEVAEVYAAGLSGLVTSSENGICGVLRFEAAGGLATMATLEVNWLSPRRLRDLAILGEHGLLVLDYAAQTLDSYKAPRVRSGPVKDWADSRSPATPDALRLPVEPREQLVSELEAFVAALRSGAPMPVSSRDALAALAVADALTQSARTGRPVAPERIE